MNDVPLACFGIRTERDIRKHIAHFSHYIKATRPSSTSMYLSFPTIAPQSYLWLSSKLLTVIPYLVSC